MNTTDGDRAATARGIFLGAAAGDALGWPQEARGGIIGGRKQRDRAAPRPEFRGWERHAGHYARRYRDPVRPGEYSDDTQLLLATARSCLAGESWWERLTQAELPAWPLYQRGGGGAVLSAASSWAEGRPPWRTDQTARSHEAVTRYRGAGANGVAMRIAPHALWARDLDDLVQRVTHDGITTHGHPRALVGALVYASALFHAASSSQATHAFGESIQAASGGLIDAGRIVPALPPDWGTARDVEEFAITWDETNKETSQLLGLIDESLQRGAMSNPEETLQRLGCADPRVNGSGTISAAAAIYLASRYAARPQDGLVSAAFLRNADTDTLASLTGAMLGALHHERWLGNLAASVQDADYIARLAENTAARMSEPPPWPSRRPRQLRRALTSALARRHGPEGEFPDGRRYRIEETSVLEDSGVLRARLHLADGQTAIIDVLANQQDGPGGDGGSHGDQAAPAIRAAPGRRDSAGESPAAADASTPPPAQPPRTLETGVILGTRHLGRSAAFYAKLIGGNIPVRADTAAIAPWLLLQQIAPDTPAEIASAIVNITVDSIAATAQRLDLDLSAGGSAAVVEVRDPDGRVVRISQRPGSPDPGRPDNPAQDQH